MLEFQFQKEGRKRNIVQLLYTSSICYWQASHILPLYLQNAVVELVICITDNAISTEK